LAVWEAYYNSELLFIVQFLTAGKFRRKAENKLRTVLQE